MVTVTVNGAGFLPSRFTDVGDTVQFAPRGCWSSQAQLNATVPVKSLGTMVRL